MYAFPDCLVSAATTRRETVVKNSRLATACSPAIVVASGISLVSASSTAASALIIPAPAPAMPASGRNVLVSCSAAFVSAGRSDPRASSTSAAAPLTNPAAWLVPDS